MTTLEHATRGARRLAAILEKEVRPDGVALLTIDDPIGAIAMVTPAFAAELLGALEAALADRTVRALVVRSGKADRFLVGVDLGYVRAIRYSVDAEAMSRDLARRFARIGASPKPVVAYVHGAALGAGLELALACHAAVASDDPGTVLGLPEVTFGLVPAANGLFHVAERAGLRIALDMGRRGERVSAVRALALGLVDDVVPAASGLEVACALARRLAADPRHARTLRRARRRRSVPALTRLLVDRNPIGRAVLFRHERAAVRETTRGHAPAEARVVELLACYGAHGLRRAADLAPRVVGDLVVSESAHRLIDLFFARVEARKGPAPTTDEQVAYATRILRPYREEANRLVAEGAARDEVDLAMVDWGFAVGPFGLRPPERRRRPAGGIPPDDIALRCSLAMIDEALRCLEDGTVRSARDGDLAAIDAAGFPAFRGGPFRYVEVLGAAEVLRRVRSLQQRFGARFEPPALLLELARTARCLY